jgi:hypothetical protein
LHLKRNLTPKTNLGQAPNDHLQRSHDLCYLLGCYGEDAAILAPATISGDLLHQSFSTLISKAVALKCAMPVLEQDPLELDAPPPSNDSPGPARLHVEFNEPENSPVIVALPATFAVPLGISAPTNWRLNSGNITEADFACEAGRAWIRATTLTDAHYDGKSIHDNPAVFIAEDLDLAPFVDHDMAPTIQANVTMLAPNADQYKCIISIAKEERPAGNLTRAHPALRMLRRPQQQIPRPQQPWPPGTPPCEN